MVCNVQMNGYKQIGPEVPVGHVEVSLADVLPLRQQALGEFMPVATNKRSKIELTEDGVNCSDSFGIKFSDPDYVTGTATDRYVSVMSSAGILPKDWNLNLTYRQHNPDNDHQVKSVSYRFKTLGGEIFVATKAVRFIMGASVILGTATGPVETITQSRKAYERPVRPLDCQFLSQFLDRTIKRAKV